MRLRRWPVSALKVALLGRRLVLMSGQRVKDARKRRSERVEWSVPVVLYRRPIEGSWFSEKTHTLVVNAHGALMALVEKVAPEQKLLLQNTASGEQRECRVVYVKKELAGTD